MDGWMNGWTGVLLAVRVEFLDGRRPPMLVRGDCHPLVLGPFRPSKAIGRAPPSYLILLLNFLSPFPIFGLKVGFSRRY
ncbi:hypothetical protein FA15DRAFT_672579 [Coprinopsis marcescibilis]|uniref:Uncharacterized protein n=1 Tax=Coprinopsis marcescibilis TaxID=230819 RepID=A0A5C3KN58_COPMA|nr:hypothetical protein FA15DRAFT_672579 [Coprinopsis marcescibilis]